MEDLNIEKGKISALQLTLLAAVVLEGAVYVLSFTATLSKHDTWLVILTSLIIAVPFGYIYAFLAKRFPGRNLVAIHNLIYGRYLGTAVSLYYLGYFLLVFSFTIRDVGDFYNIFFMRDTPREIILMVFVCASAYAVWNGIEVLGRLVPFTVTLISLVIIGTTFILLPQMEFAHFLPIGELSLIDLIHSTQIISEIPFGVAMITFLPLAFVTNDYHHTVKTVLLGLQLGAAFFMVIAIRNTAVLGNTEALLYSSSFQTSRLINIGFLSRLDILFAIGHTFGQFSLNSIYFYITVLLLSQIMGLRTYLPLIFPLGCIGVILAMIVYPSVTAHFQNAQNVEIMFFFPAMFIFPPLSLFLAKVRNLPWKGSL
jgi:spore germination protein KB